MRQGAAIAPYLSESTSHVKHTAKVLEEWTDRYYSFFSPLPSHPPSVSLSLPSPLFLFLLLYTFFLFFCDSEEFL